MWFLYKNEEYWLFFLFRYFVAAIDRADRAVYIILLHLSKKKPKYRRLSLFTRVKVHASTWFMCLHCSALSLSLGLNVYDSVCVCVFRFHISQWNFSHSGNGSHGMTFVKTITFCLRLCDILNTKCNLRHLSQICQQIEYKVVVNKNSICLSFVSAHYLSLCSINSWKWCIFVASTSD